MSMYLTDKGTAYADTFFTLTDGRIINNDNGKTMGIHIRTIPSSNYLIASELPWYKRLASWFWTKDAEYQRKHNPPPEAIGTLADTMRAMEKDIADEKDNVQ